MMRAHRIRLYPSDVQATYFVQACGVARFAWNWALAEWKRSYEAHEPVSEAQLRKKLNAVKRQEFPWMLDVTKCAPQLAIKDLGVAFKNFFEGRAAFPQFKKKGQRESFRISNDQFVIEGERMRVPNLGWVHLAEPLRFTGDVRVLGATISRTAGIWYASVQVSVADPAPIHRDEDEKDVRSVEVRLDPEKLAVLSDGGEVELPKAHEALIARAGRLRRSLERKAATPGTAPSRNYRRTEKKLARLRVRLSNVRNDALHRLTRKLSEEYGQITVDATPVTPPEKTGQKRKSDPFRPTSCPSAFEFRRQLSYKAKETGSRVKA
jgi:putative transposase